MPLRVIPDPFLALYFLSTMEISAPQAMKFCSPGLQSMDPESVGQNL